MPFTRDGLWQSPTEQDLDAFRKTLVEEKRQQINASPEIMKQLVAGLEDSRQSESSNIDFFRTVSKLQGPVDIVIPVYGGLHVLKDCLDSIEARTNWPYNLWIVDDASPDPEVKAYLESRGMDKGHVIYNNKNRGFAATVNRGVGAGRSPYVVILNSDVIVTEGWLSKIVMAMEADKRNVIVNPITNNTALTNVSMYTGKSYLDMDAALNRVRNIRYPETMPTGFCMAVRRDVWQECGPFDEAYGSYGEETDFWFKVTRARTEEGVLKGYRAVLADNCYLFHERGTSFSQLGEGAHIKQRRAGSERFHKLHPDFGEWQKGYDIDGAVGGLRTKIPPAAFHRKYKGNIAWLVKSAGPCGGMNFITDTVNKLIEEGYNAKVIVICAEKEAQASQQLVTAHLHCAPMIFINPDTFLEDFGENVFTEGKVIASVTELSNLAKALDDRYIGISGMNHVQSWDMELAQQVNRKDLFDTVEKAYRSLPNLVSSHWVAGELKKLKAEVTDVVVPGVDPNLFHVRQREKGDDRFTVGILMDEMYKYKGYEEGVEFCNQLKAAFDERGDELRIMAVAKDSVPECTFVVGTGQLSQSAMALLMANELDVFVDPARVHSYGLPALEALFSGCASVTFGNKGEKEYSSWFKDKLFTSKDISECVAWIMEYERPKVRKGFDPTQHGELCRSYKVKELVTALYPEPEKQIRTRIEVVTPHLRKHGGPTTNISLANLLQDNGHNVSMSMIYTDWNPEVFNMAQIPLRTKWKKMPSDAKVVIINSDNPFAKQIMDGNPDKKYIMYKLSHNERFKQSENDNLNLGWDHIITSTQWLKDVCMDPKEGWDHVSWPDEKVTVAGWFHYGHNTFAVPPQNRTYGDGTSGFRIGTLIHEHKLKGTELAMAVIEGLKKKWEGSMHAVGFGEAKARLPWHWQYLRSIPRNEMAHVMRQLDIWYGASFTEGLGRMSLEAMSAGAAVITTDTGAEFLRHEENCLLYEVGDAQTGAELVDRLVQDRDLMQKLVINGYQTATEAADPANFDDKVNSVIREVLR